MKTIPFDSTAALEVPVVTTVTTSIDKTIHQANSFVAFAFDRRILLWRTLQMLWRRSVSNTLCIIQRTDNHIRSFHRFEIWNLLGEISSFLCKLASAACNQAFTASLAFFEANRLFLLHFCDQSTSIVSWLVTFVVSLQIGSLSSLRKTNTLIGPLVAFRKQTTYSRSLITLEISRAFLRLG